MAQSLPQTWAEDVGSSRGLSWTLFDSALRKDGCRTRAPLSPRQTDGKRQGFRSGHPPICKVQLTPTNLRGTTVY